MNDENTSTKLWGNPEQVSQDTSESSHEFSMEAEQKWHRVRVSSVYTHFPKDTHCDICLKTKITRTSCRRRAGTIVSRAEHFADLIKADQKVLSEGCESRNNHPYAVVLQDLRQSGYNHTRVKQIFPRDPEEHNEVPGADEETKSHLH